MRASPRVRSEPQSRLLLDALQQITPPFIGFFTVYGYFAFLGRVLVLSVACAIVTTQVPTIFKQCLDDCRYFHYFHRTTVLIRLCKDSNFTITYKITTNHSVVFLLLLTEKHILFRPHFHFNAAIRHKEIHLCRGCPFLRCKSVSSLLVGVHVRTLQLTRPNVLAERL